MYYIIPFQVSDDDDEVEVDLNTFDNHLIEIPADTISPKELVESPTMESNKKSSYQYNDKGFLH